MRRKFATIVAACAAIAAPIALVAQAARPVAARHLWTSWPTHYGDYSGRRYSPLAQITAANVKTLSLAWTHRATAEEGDNAGGEYRAGDPYYSGRPAGDT